MLAGVVLRLYVGKPCKGNEVLLQLCANVTAIVVCGATGPKVPYLLIGVAPKLFSLKIMGPLIPYCY